MIDPRLTAGEMTGVLRFVGFLFRAVIALPLAGVILLGFVVCIAEELFSSVASSTAGSFLNDA